ncbi:DsrE family protein [Flavihumibacter fluvii]|uniref:DsrE family protein n=1 Tax=Flavihumibacter fluvii TaxID=2838157 RepID=UPI001BDEE066|nr:DsrE family protein [Flavihumibacter fluvii]ULQ54710.1 DsrE family protein [Flavihumibacter fluvii]
MKKLLFISTLLLLYCFHAAAQKVMQKIVIDFTKPDTADFRFMIRQLNNVVKEAPNTRVEVVCSMGGLFILVKDKTNVAADISELQKVFDIKFVACANTMHARHVEKDQLLPAITIVPVAILELAGKQQEGYSYLKAGQ